LRFEIKSWKPRQSLKRKEWMYLKLSISPGKPRNRERKTERPMPMMGLEVMRAKLCKRIKSKRKD
jgi:hypothetical protein